MRLCRVENASTTNREKALTLSLSMSSILPGFVYVDDFEEEDDEYEYEYEVSVMYSV